MASLVGLDKGPAEIGDHMTKLSAKTIAAKADRAATRNHEPSLIFSLYGKKGEKLHIRTEYGTGPRAFCGIGLMVPGTDWESQPEITLQDLENDTIACPFCPKALLAASKPAGTPKVTESAKAKLETKLGTMLKVEVDGGAVYVDSALIADLIKKAASTATGTFSLEHGALVVVANERISLEPTDEEIEKLLELAEIDEELEEEIVEPVKVKKAKRTRKAA